MESLNYSTEKAVQILILTLKANNINKIVASPGTTNITFVASVQQDSFFNIYSCVDERSAAYMACGMASESGEPVVLSCTGATASRNYIPALTEAYYRKLPILAVTATQDIRRIGNLVPQVIDRRSTLNDIVNISEHIDFVSDAISENDAILKINRAVLELFHHGGGPAHINLTTRYSRDFSIKELPEYRIIRRYNSKSLTDIVSIPNSYKVAILIGEHKPFSSELTTVIDDFCVKYDAVVFCDHTSGYNGKFAVSLSLINSQENFHSPINNVDLLVHLGGISGDYPVLGICPGEVWRVNEDGELRDLFFGKLSSVFEMTEQVFFTMMVTNVQKREVEKSFYNQCCDAIFTIENNIPEIPFSNVWLAQQTAPKIPVHSTLYLSILNTLRSWNFFDIPASVSCFSNTGGFGIDGGMSSLIGASLCNKDKLYFLIIGDLSFFYDMNVLANKHIGRNLRILLINNGCGTEFKNYNHFAAMFEDKADVNIAGQGHFGCKSDELVKHFVEDLGFEYYSAHTKKDYIAILKHFVSEQIGEKPILVEAFTTPEDESEAQKLMNTIIPKVPEKKTIRKRIKRIAINMLGEEHYGKIREILFGD